VGEEQGGLHVTFKEGFTPKDREERTVPFGQELCDALKAHKQASGNPPDDALLFPHNGKVHRHIIRNLKQCARVASLRGDWYLHRFRQGVPSQRIIGRTAKAAIGGRMRDLKKQELPCGILKQ